MTDKPNSPKPSCANSTLSRSFGPVSELERHLPADWWRTLFNALYLKTDGDVVENDENTRQDIELIMSHLPLDQNDRIFDLCCGQGRHALTLARMGFNHVAGLDRSHYLIQKARQRAKKNGLNVRFHEGDARRFRRFERLFHVVLIMGNSFGYFEQPSDDEAVLHNVRRSLEHNGSLMLDLVDGEWMRDHFERRSWEWIDMEHFVCREREMSQNGQRIITREVITHAEKGIIADQFYAERLYSRTEIVNLFEKVGFRSIQIHEPVESLSSRGQDLGMMAHRMVVTAVSPMERKRKVERNRIRNVTVLLGDPKMPDTVKLNGKFNPEDMDTIRRLKAALEKLPGYRFTYLDDHASMIRSLIADPPEFVFNLCDEGYDNDALKELHVPAILDMLNVPYTGSGPATLGLSYDKSLVTAVASALEIPTPMETYISSGDTTATLPTSFPALVKPNFGDSSIGITKDAVVQDGKELMKYLEWVRKTLGSVPVLVQEYLCGTEFSVGVIGNSGLKMTVLPILEVDYSGLPEGYIQILGYESKWQPDSPWWNSIRYRPAQADEETLRLLSEYSMHLFERLTMHDYARFDFRTGADGVVKLMEVNPNPGWCWDGKMNLMAEMADMRYADFLELILKSSEERLLANHLRTTSKKKVTLTKTSAEKQCTWSR